MMSENDSVRLVPENGQSGPTATDGRCLAVDTWLRRDLTARYDPTLAESLPAAVLALLSELH